MRDWKAFVVVSQLSIIIGLSKMLERCAYREIKMPQSQEAEAGDCSGVRSLK